MLIGLREGLEAGLVVSILLAAVRKAVPHGERISTAPIWLGVLGAVTVAAGFATILTYSTDVLSSSAQEIVGGTLSVLAVALVTGMVFWMRRTAASMSAQLRGEVHRAVAIGAGALTLTAFLSVGREGLETTLFLWTAVKASGATVAPLFGAALGLAIAIGLCWLLYRQAVRLNLGVFFNRTAIVLLVIAAGVLAYGLGDLQDAGILPGHTWVAFDLTGSIDPGSWWVSIITGVTELAPRMTVLQVVAWVVYLAITLTVFLRARNTAPRPAAPAEQPERSEQPSRWAYLAGRHTWLVAAVLVVVPVLITTGVVVTLPAPSATATTVTVTGDSCAKDWTTARSGAQTFTVTNRSDKAGEINLDDSGGAIIGEIETIGPATTAQLTATLGSGTYSFRCLMSGKPAMSSAAVTVHGLTPGGPRAVKPVRTEDLEGPNQAYQRYAAGVLNQLTGDTRRLRDQLAKGDLDSARDTWRTAQLDWERVGASYNSFGEAGTAVAGLPDGLPGGASDPGFTGLHRLEYGLWHGQSPQELLPVADRLLTDIGTVVHDLGSDDLAGDPTNLPVRAHEALEDAQRDHLSGVSDQGAHAGYAETDADITVTRVLLGELEPLLTEREPGLVRRISGQLDRLHQAVAATGGRAHADVPLPVRQQVNAALGAVLETLDTVPDLLEIPPTH